MGLHPTQYKGLLGWIDARMPSLMIAFRTHMLEYYAPKNVNVWYFFGSFALMVLGDPARQRHFAGDALQAGLESGLLVGRIHHARGERRMVHPLHAFDRSIVLFIVVYLHMFRGLLYGSYRKPRELVWIVGCVIFLSLMAESFFGYLLPWGQMSFWGAQVIINLFRLDPADRTGPVGLDSRRLRGRRCHLEPLLLVPHRPGALALIGLVVAHIFALHDVGSNNPDGIEIKDHTDANGRPLDSIPFHPYYTVHDLYGLGFFFTAYSAVLFFAPELGGVFLEGNNFIPADPFQTPTHIAPLWYFTPYYSILRATTSEFMIWLGLGTAVPGRVDLPAGAPRPRGVWSWPSSRSWCSC